MTLVPPTGTSNGLARSDTFLPLIADADVDRPNQLADALTEHQVASTICGDGAEALLVIGAEQPDAVLATAALPTVDGAALTRATHARTRIPVVVGIGDGDGPAAAVALAAGATAGVAHPYRLRECTCSWHTLIGSSPASRSATRSGAAFRDPTRSPCISSGSVIALVTTQTNHA